MVQIPLAPRVLRGNVDHIVYVNHLKQLCCIQFRVGAALPPLASGVSHPSQSPHFHSGASFLPWLLLPVDHLAVSLSDDDKSAQLSAPCAFLSQCFPTEDNARRRTCILVGSRGIDAVAGAF